MINETAKERKSKFVDIKEPNFSIETKLPTSMLD